MLRLLLLAVTTLLCLGTAGAESPATTAADQPSSPTAAAPLLPPIGEVRVIETNPEIAAILRGHGSEILVVNLWATWCGPCVEELPAFINLAKANDPAKVRVVGFSLDFPDQIDTQVKPFLTKNAIPYSNVILYVDDPGAVIDEFWPNWKGDLPATFFYDKAGRKIGEIPRALTEEELLAEVARLKALQTP